MLITAAHSASDLSIRFEALVGVIIIVACVVYVFRDTKIVRAALFPVRALLRYNRSTDHEGKGENEE